MTDKLLSMPADLRQRVAADYRPVTALRSPLVRTVSIAPMAIVALFAASTWFEVRPDAPRLGWIGVWGLSLVQFVLGMAAVAAALRESIPGRGWSPSAIVLWIAMPIAAVVVVTLFSWQVSPVLLPTDWWLVGAMCFAGSAATALPVVALAAILAARAYPTRPAVAGALLGAGAGLIADGGWRMFCHFSEPSHVLSAHLAAVIASTLIGSLLAVRLCPPSPRRRSSSSVAVR